MSGRVAAFFDLDGTLMPLPSLERRFFRALRHRREIPLTNYLLWLWEALKLLPRGMSAVTHANKMYLKGLPVLNESGAENQNDSPAHKSGQTGEGQASAPPRRAPRWSVPHFFEDGVKRLTWHAVQGHALVIVSGTLEPLAKAAVRALETELADREIAAVIRVCASRLEEGDGKWSGRIFGEAMFGEAKARAIFTLAEEMGLDLSQCWAYGDSPQDRWMLAVAGTPVAVNPSARLAKIAKNRDWTQLRWRAKENSTQSPQRAQRRGSMGGEVQKNESALQDAERCS